MIFYFACCLTCTFRLRFIPADFAISEKSRQKFDLDLAAYDFLLIYVRRIDVVTSLTLT